MTHRKLISVLDSLSAEARRQVVDYVTLLKKQHELVRRPTKQNGPNLSRPHFIGMWRDRDDLKDSSAWVRKTRQQEWSGA